ncbi:MAG: response regulator [Polyangiaceae bacterium]|nr:response regulator [Polyangiaceae bacterium]
MNTRGDEMGAGSIRVLLVDDEAEFLASMSRSLQRRGFDAKTAPDGRAGLALAAKESFDVIVLDMKMPVMSGEQVFHALRRLRPRIPVIMLTGHGTIQQAFESSKEGVFEYVVKPCEVEELAQILRRAAQVRKSIPAPEEASTTGNPRVLIVDDEVELLDSLSRALRRRGMEAAVAPDAARGLAHMDRKVFDVVVLDMRMPGIPGMAALEQIKAKYPSTEVIVLTGHPSTASAVQATKLGAFDFLMKPISVEILVRRIQAAYEQRCERLELERSAQVQDILKQCPD